MTFKVYLYVIQSVVSAIQKFPFWIAIKLVFFLRIFFPKSSNTTCLIDQTKYRCLKKALMVVLVAHEKPKVFFGVKKNEKGEVEAHAWTKVGERFVSGGAGHEAFRVIKVY